MSRQLERKFLVADTSVIGAATAPPVAIRQAYIAAGKNTVRVRVAGARAWLTVRDPALPRGGYEYAIPVDEAEDMMARIAVTGIVEKDRYRIQDGATWTVDIFTRANAPLALAEITLDSPTKGVEPPAWLGEEVSDELRYRNVYLALHPYSDWKSGGVSSEAR